MAATGSTQRYKRQLDHLEHSLTAKLQELSILEQENEILRAQERALSSFISSVEGGVAVTAHMLKKQSSNAAAAAGAGAAGECPAPPGSSTAAAAAGVSLHGGSSTAAATEVSLLGDAQLLERIESKEREIQAVLQQLEAGSYEELYSTLLLRTAASNPEATAALLATPPTQRRHNWCNKVQQIALLLPKYDYPDLGRFTAASSSSSSSVQGYSSSSSSDGSSAQEVVDRLVDDVATGLLVTGLLDPPQMTLYNFMVNMSTNVVADSYPEGFWQHVAQGLQLTDMQRSALHISWKRIKSEKLSLTEQHERVLARLNQLRAQQRQQSKQFEEETHQVMQQPPDPHDEIVTRQQQHQQRFLAQQQRQQQRGLGFQGDSDDLGVIFDPRFDDLGESEIQDLLQTLDHDHHQQWLLLGLDQDQQQPPLDLLLGDQQDQGLASSDVAALAVTALASNVVAGLNDSPRASTLQQQQLQQIGQQQAASAAGLPAQHGCKAEADDPAAVLEVDAAAADVAPAATENAAAKTEQHQGSTPSQPRRQQQQQSNLALQPHSQQQQQDASALLNWQEIAVQLQEIQQHVGACTEQHEHFVPVGGKEQQQLERELNRIRGKIKMQHYCSALFWVNTLSKQQLATLYVLSWPFMPDGFALSEQLEAERTTSASTTATKSS